MMKIMLYAAALALLTGPLASAADEIYVKMQADESSILSNGREFTTEKGDYYPFIGYNGTQSLMQLKFGPFTFWIRKEGGEIVPAAGTAEAAGRYHADVVKFCAVGAGAEPAMIGSDVVRPGSAVGPDTAEAVVRLLENPLRGVIEQEVRNAVASDAGDREVDAFPVDSASHAWQNTGVRVKAGQQVLVEAARGDKWELGSGKVDAGGYNVPPANAGIALFHTGTEGEDWRFGALICAVGDSRDELNDPRSESQVGIKREVTAKNDGYVFLICNDRPERPGEANGYDDNSGIIHVKVTAIDATAKAQPGASPALSEPPKGLLVDPRVMPPVTAETPLAIARQIQGQLRGLIHEELWKALAAGGSDHEPGAFPVDATSDTWQNSGVRVKAGQHVLVEAAEGEKWDIGWGPVDAKGHAAPRAQSDKPPLFHTGTPNDDWHWGSLLCAIGDGRADLNNAQQEVEIRMKRGFTVDNDGYLYFICNDEKDLPDGRNGYADNSGVIHVKVTVTGKKPEPSPAGSPAR